MLQALAAEIEFMKNQARLEELQNSTIAAPLAMGAVPWSSSFKSVGSARSAGLEPCSKPPLPPSIGEVNEPRWH